MSLGYIDVNAIHVIPSGYPELTHTNRPTYHEDHVVTPMIDPAWKPWYRSQHNDRCHWSGGEFEQYVADILSHLHSDFINPDSMGADGDGGCDGIADGGTILYACYGADLRRGLDTADTTKDGRTANKLASDLNRALDQWSTFTTWRFVTNASIGPKTVNRIIELREKHGQDSSRPINVELWQAPDDLWSHAVSCLTEKQLDDLIPGVPRAQDVELHDLVELIDQLTGSAPDPAHIREHIRAVPKTKMNFNQIPQNNQHEFNEGRIQASRIDNWFAEQLSPDLRDAKARRFRDIYEREKAATTIPSEIVEAVYTALGGEGFRHSSPRANAVYAVTAYFFDSCDIFEEPPPDHNSGGDTSVAPD
jgi:hypothetical protein